MNTGINSVPADENRKVRLHVQHDEHGHQNVLAQMGAGPTSDPKPRFRTLVLALRNIGNHTGTREIEVHGRFRAPLCRRVGRGTFCDINGCNGKIRDFSSKF